jgi:hypothetical protein
MGQQVGGNQYPKETTASKMAMGTRDRVKPQQMAVKQQKGLTGFCDCGNYRTPFAS